MHRSAPAQACLAGVLEARRTDITEHWVERLRSRSALKDHVEQYLQRLTEVLHRAGEDGAAPVPDRSDEARAHGSQRRRLGSDLPTLVREYGLLHECILDQVEETGVRISLTEVRTLVSALVTGIAEAVDEHTRERDEARHLEAEAARSRPRAMSEVHPEDMLALFEEADALVFVLQGPELILTQANPRLFQAIGNRDALGKPLPEALPELEEQGWRVLLDTVYRTGKPAVGHEVRVWVYPQGGETVERFFNFVYAPTRKADGQVDGILVHAVDVTELVRERQKTEEALALLETLLATAPVGLSFLDRELRYVRVNQMLADMIGAPTEELLGSTACEVAPHVAAQLEPIRRQVLKTGRPVFGHEVTGTLPATGGAIHHLLFSHAPVRNRAGEVILVASAVLDITERKRAESATEERFRLLVEGVEDYAIFMLDPAGRVASWNPGAERIKGWKAEEALGLPLSSFYLPEDVRTGLPREALCIAAREGQYRAEARLVRKDGSRFWADTLITALRDECGTLRGFAKITRDISSRRQVEEENARLYQEAQEAIRVREDVVAIVSHDLRTPLNAISLSAGGLLKREDVDGRTTKAAHRIRSAADRASRMIRDLLDFNQARRRGLPVHHEPLELHEHVRRVLHEVRLAWPERRISFQASGDGRGEWDGDRLAQVVTNLVGNALQHGPADTPVRVSIRDEGSKVLLEVHNEGRPIPPEVLAELFEPYRRGPGAGVGQGSLGLGLFITRQIVLGHGGTIDVRSTVPEGTTFTVCLPRDGRAVPP
jgi:PAS domain S-box-containing protein